MTSRVRPSLHALVVAVFIVVQATAVSHELEHVLHQHDAPCGLHVAADHLLIVPAPEPALAVALAMATGNVCPHPDVLLPSAARPSDARAPPRPA